MLAHLFIACSFFIGIIFTNPIKDSIDYELLGGGVEGDMFFPDGYDPIKYHSDAKGVAAYGNRLWPNNVVPYDLSSIIDAGHRSIVLQAIDALMNATSTIIPGTTTRKPCITIRPRTASDPVFVKIQYGTGCSASVGYGSGTRSMTLENPGCFRSGTIQHEFLHSLSTYYSKLFIGIYHEQSRPDRDEYITVNYANMDPSKTHNFNKYVWGSTALNQNTPYDYGSIMHYSASGFSNNGLPTITPKDPNAKIGQRVSLSAIDIAEVRALYKCSS
ncbi:unnamed protein product [Adineta steineri]|uniref:Peptidase M12A domain-containing protein n=1 Tax=Adineta steineri TaxID=433720 RepID=A0A819DVX1_9BILA|nr:unnamed protein product [Adineta steineri]CAF3840127.1 unnamed protein product [Adineta steineri]